MKKVIYLFSIISVIAIYSCSKDSDSRPYIINASEKNHWVYYSFEKADSVQVSDPTNSTAWDVAFSRNFIKTNSGTSGIGQSGVFNTKLTDQAGFNTLTVVPDTAVFVKDTITSLPGAGGAMITGSFSASLCYWYNYNPSSSKLPSYKYVYIIKTATGKYAKMYINTYYGDDDIAGHYIIVSKYQSDGSKNLN